MQRFSTDPTDVVLCYCNTPKYFVGDPYPHSSQVCLLLKVSFLMRSLSSWSMTKNGMDFSPSFSSNCGLSISERKSKKGREEEGKGGKGMHVRTHEGDRRHYGWWIHKTMHSEIKFPNSPSPFSSVFYLCTVCHILFSHLVAVMCVWWILQKFQLYILLRFLSAFMDNFLKAFLKSSHLGNMLLLCRYYCYPVCCLPCSEAHFYSFVIATIGIHYMK